MQQEIDSMKVIAEAMNPSTQTPSDGELLQAGMFEVGVVTQLKAANQFGSQLTPANVDAAIVDVLEDWDATWVSNGSNAVTDGNPTNVPSLTVSNAILDFFATHAVTFQ
jgi:hypothetical protein